MHTNQSGDRQDSIIALIWVYITLMQRVEVPLEFSVGSLSSLRWVATGVLIMSYCFYS